MNTDQLIENKSMANRPSHQDVTLPHSNTVLEILLDGTYFILRKSLKPLITKIWIKKVTGLSNIPLKGGVILAMNHQSYFDFLCVAVISPRNIHFLAAEKFFNHWLWKHLMRTTRQIKVDRKSEDKREVHASVHNHLENRRIIGLFPEGTRSPYQDQMLKAFTGVAQYSLLKKVPVIPIGIKGAFHVMSVHDRKPKFSKSIEIHIGEPIHFLEYHLRNDLSHADYHAVTKRVMKEISALSGKEYLHE